MVEREDLANAIALNSTMFNSATAVGPAVAGVAYALVGPAWCFTLNGLSFLAVIAALAAMKLKPAEARSRATSAVQDLKEGLGYVGRNATLRALISIAGVAGLSGMAYATLMPAWAVTILGGDSTTVGLMQSARGVGSLIGALMIAALGRFRFKGRLMTVGTFMFPALLIVFAAVRWLPLSLLVLVGVGWGMMVMFNMLNTLIQTTVSDGLRGRVMGIYSLTFFGAAPIGALMAGAAADRVGEPTTILLSALVPLAYAAWLWLRAPQLRRLQ